MARNNLATGSVVNGAATFQTASIQPGTKTLVLLFVTYARPLTSPGAASTPTVTGNGLNWQLVKTVTAGAANDRGLSCFRAMGTPTLGRITITFAGARQDYCAWSVFEYSGVVTTGTSGSDAVVASEIFNANGTTLTGTVAATGDPANIVVGGIILELQLDPVRPMNPGAGFTEIHEQNPNQALGKSTTLQTQDSATFTPVISWNWTGAENAAAIGLEIKTLVAPVPGPVPTPSDPTEALIRRFEPVLFMHPEEDFYPVDAKRYVEHAALWAAKPPFDDKNNWGIVGGPFPRKPLVDAGELSGLNNESGAYIGDPSLRGVGGSDERFLELGGWKDKSETSEPDVTDSSTNVYADRATIKDLYDQDPLKSSRFWYHAELFDKRALDGVVRRMRPPDVSTLLSGFTDPALVCYYLFFPAHQQAVSADLCDNIESREAACHAGDWQCIAILLDGDGSGKPEQYTPKFFGCTGSRPTAIEIDGVYVERPYQFDDDGLTAMKVEAWRPTTGTTAGLPDQDLGHPRLFVARGSHSLYMTPGEKDVYPFPDGQESQWCGHYDTPAVTPPGLSEGGGDAGFEDTGAFLGKVLAGLSVGGALGAIAGGVAAAIEGHLPHGSGLDIVGTYDPPDKDEVPAAGAGKTIRPSGVVAAGGGLDDQIWAAKQGLIGPDGRRYDFIVDRATQGWWPNTDNDEKGFRGRWGQQVTSDFLPRRSGPRFPDYAKLFLLALAYRDSHPVFKSGG